MATNYGTSIVRDGLVMQFDIANTQKCWKGAPTTNLYPIDTYISWPSQSTHFWNGNSWVVDSTYTDPGAPGPAGVYLGKVRKYTSGALSASWSGNSYAYILKTAPMTSGQNYAMSAYTYLSPTCDIDAIDSSIESASVTTLSGGYTTSYDTSKKNTWQRQGLTGSAAGNVNYIIGYARKYGVTNGAFSGFFMIGGAMVETGTFPTPYTDDTRSNAQAILDLTGINTLTANSLTYASDNTFSFNGSNDKITLNTNTIISSTYPYTIDVAFKTSAAGTDYIFGNYGVASGAGGGLEYYVYQNKLNNYIAGNTQSATTLNLNQWYIASVTRSGSTITHYLNGVVDGSGSNAASISATNPFTIGNGHDYTSEAFGGTIGAIKIYNRALSALEVKQNFSAQRGMYGL